MSQLKISILINEVEWENGLFIRMQKCKYMLAHIYIILITVTKTLLRKGTVTIKAP